MQKVTFAKQQLQSFTRNAIEESPVIVDNPSGSRHKAKLVVSGTVKEPSFGIVDRTGAFSPLEACPLHTSILNEILPHLKTIIQEYQIPPYDIKSRSGEIKAIILSTNLDHSELMVRIVLRSKSKFLDTTNALKKLRSIDTRVKVTSINIQPIPHAILEGEEEITSSDAHSLTEQFEALTIFFEPKSFMQITPPVAKELYQTAGRWIQDVAPKNLLDLYCGVGGFALHSAQQGIPVTGIEVSKDAIHCASKAAKHNRLANCTFIQGDLETHLLNTSFDALIVNPPRRGLSPNVIDYITETLPKVICYSSCNPATLARDLEALAAIYTVTRVRFFDMFPLTDHLETLIELRLN